jgi:hypothetical protein
MDVFNVIKKLKKINLMLAKLPKLPKDFKKQSGQHNFFSTTPN